MNINYFMNEAIKEAKLAFNNNEVPVGGVLIDNKTNEIIDKDLFKILDRKQAIEKALSMAKENDLVLVTGKGSEQRMAVAGGKYVEWDDRAVIRKILHSN